MSNAIKKLTFKGLEKKEQILFKSFLNLAMSDLAYEIELIQNPDEPLEGIDIVIADATYLLSEQEEILPLATLKIGDNVALAGEGYLLRPVQWSDFKEGLIQVTAKESSSDVDEERRVLPISMALEAPEEEFTVDEFDESSRSFIDAPEYDFSLENMSVDYDSYTNADYEKVADDVKEFNDEKAEPQAVMLVTDEESRNSNSVLVIETNSLDAWDMSESEFGDPMLNNVESTSELELPDLGVKQRKIIQVKLDTGKAIRPENEIWMSEQEILAGPHTLFYVRPAQRKVYSSSEPGKWIKAMRTRSLTSIGLAQNWQPNDELKEYPLERLIWVNTLVGRSDKLDDGVTDNEEFMLLKWPHFELLELDNTLLKFTTMLFVGPESAYSIMQKTGEGRAVVYGMLNACKELGMLVSPDSIKQYTDQVNAEDEGMFGKLKDVFR